MQTTREFIHKTKRGAILKIVREHYLRDDLLCGSAVCGTCKQRKSETTLVENPPVKSSLFPFPHYVVLDTNIILDQIDILEDPSICNVIVLTTVLNEIRHKSMVIFKRFREVINQPSRNFYVFVNEHHKDTYVERQRGESSNDRNDRAIRIATRWYDEHLEDSQMHILDTKRVRVVLITDDADNRQKARDEGVLVAAIEEYVNSLPNHSVLLDKLSRKNFEVENHKKPIFPPHISPQEVQQGIKMGKLLQGVYYASRENYLEGTVNVESMEKSILIQGRENLNRAVDGDIVVVQLFPESEWSAPSEIILQEDEEDPGDTIEESEELLIAKIGKSSNVVKTPTGSIVGIVNRKWRQYCGILQPNTAKAGTKHIFVPANRKIPKIRIETRQAENLHMQRIIVAIDSWPRYSRYPQGHFIRALGPLGNIDTENEVLLREHDVPHGNFSKEVLSFLPQSDWKITDDEIEKRVDLRNLCVCSVDPPGCTDIDDALHCRELPDGSLEVGVHIADVTHFIRPGNALDKEAASRGTTVYLIGKRIDMVPELLSSNLCSLRGGEERLAFSCVWIIDKEANILKTKFHKSVIKSKKAMTYEEAQLIIDDPHQNDEIAKSLRQLNQLAKIMKKKRMDSGALVLASPEIRFQVDSETHDPIEVEIKQMRDTNSMVEEFMLLANISVASQIEKDFPECAVLRRHPIPPPGNFEPLIKAARNLGFDIKIGSGKELATSLDAAVKKDNLYFNTMLRMLATRCMMQAVYFISGTVQKEEFFHYGLAAEIYTHFTSPIRRYSDIMVHRLLAASIGADSTYAELLDKTTNQELCNNLNYRHRMAQYAGRASAALNTHLFFRGKTAEEDAYILFVRKNALVVLIPKFGLEGTIYLNSPKDDPKKADEVIFTFNEEDYTQKCGDIVFRSFDPVTVRLNLDSSNVQHEKLVFKLVKPYIKGFSIDPVDIEMMDESATPQDAEMKVIPKEKSTKKKNIETKMQKKKQKKK